MRFLEILAQHAEEHVGLELPFPAVFFGAIAITIFIGLGLITWSYRDVANRHDHKTGSAAKH